MLKILAMGREYGFLILTVLKHRLQPVLQITDIFFAYIFFTFGAEEFFGKFYPQAVQRIFNNVFDMADAGFAPVVPGIHNCIGGFFVLLLQNILYPHSRPLSGFFLHNLIYFSILFGA